MLLCHMSFKKAALRGFKLLLFIYSSQEAFGFSALTLASVMETDKL